MNTASSDKSHPTISRRTLLTLSATSVGAAAAHTFSPPAAYAHRVPVLLTDPLTLSGTLLRRVVQGAPRFVLATDRGTAFTPVYVEGVPSVLRPFVGLHVDIRGRLANDGVLPVIFHEGPPVVSLPSLTPDFERTLLEIPLTSAEEEAMEVILQAVLIATFENPDPATDTVLRDQLVHAVTNPDLAAALRSTPFIALEDDDGVFRTLTLGDAVRRIESIMLEEAAIRPLHTTEQKVERILLAILLFVVGVLLVRIGKATAKAVKEQVTQLLNNDAVRLAVELLFLAIQSFLSGQLSLNSFLGALKDGIVTIGKEMGPAMLAVLKTLKWWEYLAAAASAAFVYLKAAKAIANAAAFTSELANIVTDP
jgi:hypothetical protein